MHDEENFGGTVRTLDGAYKQATRQLPLGKGLLSRKGYTVFDDSNSLILAADGLCFHLCVLNCQARLCQGHEKERQESR